MRSRAILLSLLALGACKNEPPPPDQLATVTTAAANRDPLDATPDAAGQNILQVLALGAPLVAPDGVAVNTGGDAFISDKGAAEADGALFILNQGDATLTPFVTGLDVGDPAGIALTLDESTLLVSAKDP